jgi:hypothetical protein
VGEIVGGDGGGSSSGDEVMPGGINFETGAGVFWMNREFREAGGSGASGGVKKRERIGIGMNREKNGAGGMAACQGMKRRRFGCRNREPLRASGRAAVSAGG